MYYIHIVKRFRAHCGFYAIENKLLLLHTLIFLGPIGLRLQLADPNGKQITSHSSIIRGAYWVKITAGKKTAAVLRRRRSRSLT